MAKIYLSAPGLISCAGKNKEELYGSCLNGNQTGFAARHLPASSEESISSFPVGQTGESIINLINKALEQIQPEIEKAISKYGTEKVGVCFGTCDNGSEVSIGAHREFMAKGNFPKDYDLHFQSASFPAEYIAKKFSLTGPVMTIATACASSASAIIRGAELIKTGICSAVIAGGADIVSDTVLLGFHALEAVSDKLTNPFSKNRKGINLGDGAAFFLLDTEKISNVRLLGCGESADAYHMTAPGQDGAGPVKAMQTALANACLKPENIDYVNLHGTGTALNDSAEALAMKTVFGGRDVAASSTKPITGHTLGAAGALETAICWMAINSGTKGLPVHCWDSEKDMELGFSPVVPGHKLPVSICMTNSFAFGGCNVSLILGGINE